MRFKNLSLLALLATGCGAWQNTKDKPVTIVQQSVSYKAMPTTLIGMVSEAAAIVVGRYDGDHRVVFAPPAPGAFAWTDYTLQVQEVLKEDSRLRDRRLQVRLPGGTVEGSTNVVRYVT